MLLEQVPSCGGRLSVQHPQQDWTVLRCTEIQVEHIEVSKDLVRNLILRLEFVARIASCGPVVDVTRAEPSRQPVSNEGVDVCAAYWDRHNSEPV